MTTTPREEREQFLIASARLDTAEAFLRATIKVALEAGHNRENIEAIAESESSIYLANTGEGAS